jgi:hypothetical protein
MYRHKSSFLADDDAVEEGENDRIFLKGNVASIYTEQGSPAWRAIVEYGVDDTAAVTDKMGRVGRRIGFTDFQVSGV